MFVFYCPPLFLDTFDLPLLIVLLILGFPHFEILTFDLSFRYWDLLNPHQSQGSQVDMAGLIQIDKLISSIMPLQ